MDGIPKSKASLPNHRPKRCAPQSPDIAPGHGRDYSALLGAAHPGEHRDNGVHDHKMLRDIRWAVKAVNQSFGNRFTCLMQAMAGKTILNRRSVPNTLVLGAKISRVVETNYNEGMSAHAWLWAGGIILLGGEAREDFLPVTSYQSQ